MMFAHTWADMSYELFEELRKPFPPLSIILSHVAFVDARNSCILNVLSS
jgi:hypothetical protein